MPAEAVAALMRIACDAHDDEEEIERWVARARRGDSRAIDLLISRYRQPVIRLATHVLHRPDEAEDVAQEAFVKALAGITTFRGECRFYTWLYRIVVRICLDRNRAAKALIAAIDLDDAGPQRSMVASTDAIDTRLLVESLMRRLDGKSRAVLVLREVEGLEYAEIAEVLKLPVGRVRWRLHAARAAFRSMWTAAMKDSNDV